MHNTNRVLALATAGLLSLGACDDSPAGPSRPGDGGSEPVHLYVGAYQLMSVDGATLPAIVFEGEIDVEGGTAQLRVSAVEGTLTLGADGRYELRVRHMATIDGNPAPPANWVDRGDYQIGADGFAFSSSYIQNVAFQGTGDGDGVTTRQDLAGEGSVVGYRFGRM